MTHCDTYAQTASLRVDRELGPAESEALDRHLAVCPACRRRAQESEALSAILRQWDAETVEPARAPARLRLAIRAAASEQGRWRRKERRLVRRVRWATAASVLLALGAGLLAGLLVSHGSTGDGASYAAPVASTPAGSLPEEPAPAPAAPVLPAPRRVPSALADVDVDGTTLIPLSPAERRLAAATLTRLHGRFLRRSAFERRWQEPAVWFIDPATGEERLITWRDYRFGDRDAATVAAAARPPASQESPTVADDNPPQDTGRRLADFLRLPGRRERIESLLTGLRLPLQAGPADQRTKLADVMILAGSKRPGPRGERVLDLVRAVDEGVVELREGRDDDLVVLARDLRTPLFIPAGELIAGGRVDRVVLENVWVAAAVGDSRVVVPCAAASTQGAVRAEEPTPTGMMGGPALRRLLARGASAEHVRAWIAQRVPILDGWGRDYTLLSFYSQASHDKNLRTLAEALLRIRARGFVVADPAGNFRAIEVSDLAPEVAAPLLVRLMEGYLAEASMDQLRARLQGEAAPATASTGGRDTALALLDLVGHETTFLSRPWDGQAARTLRQRVPTSGAAVLVTERYPGGQAALTSVFSR